MTDVPSRRPEPQVMIADAARSVAVVSVPDEHHIATGNEVKDTLPSPLHGGAGVVVDLTETAFVAARSCTCSMTAGASLSRGEGRASVQLATPSIVRRAFELLGAREGGGLFTARADAIRAVSQAS